MKLRVLLVSATALSALSLFVAAQVGGTHDRGEGAAAPVPSRQPATFGDAAKAPAPLPSDRYDGPLHRSGVIPSDEQTRPDEPESARKGGSEEASAIPAHLLGDPYFLSFAGGIWRPPAGEKLDPELAIRVATAPRPGESTAHTYAYVMFQGRITEAKQAQVEALGVRLLRPHPSNCWAARVPLNAVLPVSQLDVVRWVGVPRFEQKLHPVLLKGIREGTLRSESRELPGSLRVFVNLQESDLNERSVRLPGPLPFEANAGEAPKPGNPAAAGWSWETNGVVAEELERRGLRDLKYWEAIRAYEAFATPQMIADLAALDFVAFLEWSPPLEHAHDRHIPQVGQDYYREVYPVTTQTIGVIDSGFHLRNGGYNGHFDLNKWAVGWNHWGGGGCGSTFCDEAGEGYHGTHVLGTIAGTGVINPENRGMSPHIGSTAATQRLFLAKCFCYDAFQRMRNDYTDGSGNVTPRPIAVSNSWRATGCPGGAPGNWVGSEAGARLLDDEVFVQDQCYVFAAGNEGDCPAGTCGIGGTIGIPSNAKNALTVGATNDFVSTTPGEGDPGMVACWSSRGPCSDGRWKPNVSAPGCSTNSTQGNSTDLYWTKCGTSMATPMVTGVLSEVAERYPETRTQASLMRAWAMATALPWQGQTGIANAHRNAYGTGRVSSLRATNGGGALPWTRNWGWGSIDQVTDTFDFDVGSGVTRLVLVMTWDDPQSSPGANPSLVKDLDLYLDREPFTAPGNSGEYSSTSFVNNVEHLVVNNPPAGSYRVKVYPAGPAGTTVRYGFMAVQFLEDPTPPYNLTASVADQYVQPNQAVEVTVTASATESIATNVFLDKGNHPAMTFTGTTSTLKDGVVLTDTHDNNGDFLFGDVLRSSSRSIVYGFTTGGAGGNQIANFTSRSDNAGNDGVTATWVVDGTRPPNPANLSSTTHTPNVWSNNPAIGFSWTQGPDNLSGLDGYGEALSTVNPPGVAMVRDFGPGTSRLVNLTSDYSSLYYGLRVVDRSDNWGDVVSVGPYLIDTVAPGTPWLITTPQPTATWTNVATHTFSWLSGGDDRSGVAGYALRISVAPLMPLPMQVLGPATTTDITFATTGGDQFVNLRAVDNAGNWGGNWGWAGPYRIDTVLPTVTSFTIQGGAAETTGLAVNLQINASDAHSGLVEMRFQNNGGVFSAWVPYAVNQAWNLTNNGGSTATGTRTVTVEVRDRAGNVRSTSDTIYYYIAPSYFGNSRAGSLGVPTFTVSGVPGVGRSVTFTTGNTAAPVLALYLGLSNVIWNGLALPYHLQPVGSPGCYVNVSLDALLWYGPVVAVPVGIPDEPALAGIETFWQGFLLGDPSGLTVIGTRGARVLIAGQ